MPTMSRTDAVSKLRIELARLTDDDLVEVYNELFPEKPIKGDSIENSKTQIVQVIEEHVRKGLEAEEIVDLWNVIFPRYRNVWFDESDETIHCDDDSVDDDDGISSGADD